MLRSKVNFFCVWTKLCCGCNSAVVFTIINFVLQINCVEEKPVEGNWQSGYCAHNKLCLCWIEIEMDTFGGDGMDE